MVTSAILIWFSIVDTPFWEKKLQLGIDYSR